MFSVMFDNEWASRADMALHEAIVSKHAFLFLYESPGPSLPCPKLGTEQEQ